MRHMPRPNADREAVELLAALGIDEVPVPLERIAEHLNAQVVYQRMDGQLSGMTYRQDGNAVIGVNNTHHRRRQRFTLAHELGHLRLHRGKPLLVDSTVRVDFRDGVSSLATDREEIEANAFAAALLMPKPAVVSRMQKLQQEGVRTRERLVTDLATAFDVSTEAMGYRLLNLGLVTG